MPCIIVVCLHVYHPVSVLHTSVVVCLHVYHPVSVLHTSVVVCLHVYHPVSVLHTSVVVCLHVYHPVSVLHTSVVVCVVLVVINFFIFFCTISVFRHITKEEPSPQTQAFCSRFCLTA